MGNTVLSRVGICSLGAVGAAEAACTDMGSHVETGKASIETLVLSATAEENTATDAGLNDMVTDVMLSAAKVSVAITGVQQITKDNIAKALNATATANGVVFSGGGGEPTFFSGYFHGFKLDGDPKILHIVKGYITPNASLGLGKDQQKPDIAITCMADTDSTFELDGETYKVFAFLPDTVDTTAPTVSTVSPADTTTAVAKAATTLVTWLFSEAIRSADVHSRNFFVYTEAGAEKAGTLSLSGDGLTVTFTPTTAWGATTTYHAVAANGIRDLAGNALVAKKLTWFETGS